MTRTSTERKILKKITIQGNWQNNHCGGILLLQFLINFYCSSSKPKKETKQSAEVSQATQRDSSPDTTRPTSTSTPTTLRINSQPGKSTLTSDKLEPKKKKASDIMNLEDALKELNIQTTVSASKKRQPCQCQGKSLMS
jgi:hypothetical protein